MSSGQPTRKAMWGMIPPTKAALEEHVNREACTRAAMWGMTPPTRAALETMSRGQPTREVMWGMTPQTRAALEEHVKRAAYQGGHVGYDTSNQGSSGGACQEGSLPGRPCGV